MAPRRTVSSFLRNELRLRSVALYALVFLVCFLTAKFGQYLFYEQNTSPALIWAPFGIALGAILIGGYRMWLPVVLAELLAVFSAGISPLPVMLAATVGQTLQPLLGAWVLNKLGFDGNFARIRDAFVFLGVIFFAAMIAPSIASLTQLLTHSLTATVGITWTRSWAGGVLSILILTPLITVWFPLRKLVLSRLERIETILVLAALSLLLIFSSWTPYGADYGVSVVYVYLAIMVWISIRMEPRILTVALLLTAVLGMGGEFFLQQATPLNQRLFSQELAIELFAVIFLVFSALVEERRRGRLALQQNVMQLQRALERIENEDAAKNQFIATLAHELRNPLAPVVSALDLLSLQKLSTETMHIIEGAQRELSVMRRLLDDILDVARVSQTKFKLQKEVVDVRPIIERCVESTKNFLSNRNHTLSVIMSQEPIMLDVDPVRFQQIIVNILNNAAKYTKNGGQIELRCEKIGAQAVIQITDNGVGIPRESLKDIFEPFRQIRPTPQIGTGLGIGLWLTKQLVEIHGGTIEATSQGADRGSSFVLRFPLKTDTSWSMKETRSAPDVTAPSMKILIVDDNQAAAQSMEKLLKLKGHEAHVAYDGTSAIATVEHYYPHVVLLDVGLPDMSGYDVARLLRAQKPEITLIALTGYGQVEDKENAKSAGFNYHLTKPVGIADIEAVLVQVAR